jgi:cell division protein ZapA (FtsZ GTPase activity inhibitor)
MGKNKISISVAGNEFVVTTDEEREYTLELARTVDGKIRTILDHSKLNVGLAAILACMDLCDENEKNKLSCARLRDEIRQYLVQVEAAGAEQQKIRDEYREKLDHLEQENKLLREQLAQYEAGQIGFQS